MTYGVNIRGINVMDSEFFNLGRVYKTIEGFSGDKYFVLRNPMGDNGTPAIGHIIHDYKQNSVFKVTSHSNSNVAISFSCQLVNHNGVPTVALIQYGYTPTNFKLEIAEVSPVTDDSAKYGIVIYNRRGDVKTLFSASRSFVKILTNGKVAENKKWAEYEIDYEKCWFSLDWIFGYPVLAGVTIYGNVLCFQKTGTMGNVVKKVCLAYSNGAAGPTVRTGPFGHIIWPAKNLINRPYQNKFGVVPTTPFYFEET